MGGDWPVGTAFHPERLDAERSEDGESRPKQHRHTARRICDRLKEERAFTGGCTIVKDCVREDRPAHKEVFVPLAHPPGTRRPASARRWR
jgi:hypothetical protein